MATLPTHEEIAGEILSLFVGHFNCQPGEVLRIDKFLAVWHNRGLRVENFKLGVELAAQRGCGREVLRGGTSFRLIRMASPPQNQI